MQRHDYRALLENREREMKREKGLKLLAWQAYMQTEEIEKPLRSSYEAHHSSNSSSILVGVVMVAAAIVVRGHLFPPAICYH